MKKTIFLIIILLMAIIVCMPNCSYADDTGLGDLENYRGTNPDSTELTRIVGEVLGIIRAIGTVVSVVVLISIGLKYMLASVQERADYKKTLIPYIAGAVILFTGTTIPQLIYEFMEQM